MQLIGSYGEHKEIPPPPTWMLTMVMQLQLLQVLRCKSPSWQSADRWSFMQTPLKSALQHDHFTPDQPLSSLNSSFECPYSKEHISCLFYSWGKFYGYFLLCTARIIVNPLRPVTAYCPSRCQCYSTYLKSFGWLYPRYLPTKERQSFDWVSKIIYISRNAIKLQTNLLKSLHF